MDGTVPVDVCNGVLSSGIAPGKILGLMLELRKRCGVIQAKQKPGMKFKTRASDDLINAIRPIANELGILIYPAVSIGTTHVVEDGTLAGVNLLIVVQAVEDASRISIGGFGLGADQQDKAGGKAGTYAFKQALLQALLAMGQDDTDDTDTPIRGGVKPRKLPVAIRPPSRELVQHALESSTNASEYANARVLLSQCHPDDIVALRGVAKAAKERCE